MLIFINVSESYVCLDFKYMCDHIQQTLEFRFNLHFVSIYS